MIEAQEGSFLSIFSQLKDPRVENDNKKHLLIDIVTIAVCAVICKCETWEEIADYGEEKQDWFKTFLKLPEGIPSHDTFRRVFMLLDPKEFGRCFLDWTNSIRKTIKGDVIAIDGKTVRGSAHTSLGKRAIHMVSAWSTENGIVLSQLKVDEKSNEITAIPEILDSLDIDGATITIDAMGCQKEIAAKIISKKADYVLALKQNQESFFERVEQAFARGFEIDFENMNYSYHQTTDSGHGRIEERNYFKINDVEFLNRSSDWKGFRSIGLVEAIVTRNGKVSVERRYYIASFEGDAEQFGQIVRKHWQVENNLHWMLDVQFREDDGLKRAKNSAANFSVIKRIALNLLKKESSPWKLKKKMMKAIYNEDFLMKILVGHGV